MSKVSIHESANSLGTRISTEDFIYHNIKDPSIPVSPCYTKDNFKKYDLVKPQPQYLFEKGMSNVWPSETAEGNVLVSIIAHLYFGTVKLNKYIRIVKLGGIPI